MSKPIEVGEDGCISKEDYLKVLEKGLERIYREEVRQLKQEQIDELYGKTSSAKKP